MNVQTLSPVSIGTVECLLVEPVSAKAKQIFSGMAKGAARSGIRFDQTTTYRGHSDVLMIWGPGAPNRFPSMQAQIESHRHVVAWDLAYWSRDTKVRCSIDGAHPKTWVMRKDWPSNRLESDHVRIDDVWNPNGPIVVAGLGPKARVQYGADVIDRWESEMVEGCRDRWDRRVIYRQKNGMGTVPFGAGPAPVGPIEPVLEGASLVITWHSNVAVDAIRLGIPVVCRDGAAAAVCARELPNQGFLEPLHDATRMRFLSNLAWFQWEPAEGFLCWAFLKELLS